MPNDAARTTVFDLYPRALDGLHPDQPEYWAALWRETQRAAQQTGHGRECWQGWDEEDDAREYWKLVSNRDITSDRATDITNEVQPGWRVLDIGAGPGNVTIPMAAKAAHVTAVEPARGMTTVLRENLDAAGCTNVDVIPARWDDVDPDELGEPYDLVVISFAFGMNDLLDTINKIRAVAKNQVIFYWHAGPQVRDTDSAVLWPLLHDRPFVEIPKANMIFNLLYSLGIYPNVTSIPRPFVIAYETFDEAVAMFCKRYDVDPTDTAKAKIINDYLTEHLIAVEGGFQHSHQQHAMRITWNV